MISIKLLTATANILLFALITIFTSPVNARSVELNYDSASGNQLVQYIKANQIGDDKQWDEIARWSYQKSAINRNLPQGWATAMGEISSYALQNRAAMINCIIDNGIAVSQNKCNTFRVKMARSYIASKDIAKALIACFHGDIYQAQLLLSRDLRGWKAVKVINVMKSCERNEQAFNHQ